jgi:hypothetical protein
MAINQLLFVLYFVNGPHSPRGILFGLAFADNAIVAHINNDLSSL